MSTITVKPDALITKDTNEKRVVIFDWDTNSLAASVTISTSTFTITAVRPRADTALTKDNESILAGSRKTQVRIIGGTLGALYRLTNHIITNENPAQEKEGSIFVQIADK